MLLKALGDPMSYQREGGSLMKFFAMFNKEL
jgi:hypothetical protein